MFVLKAKDTYKQKQLYNDHHLACNIIELLKIPVLFTLEMKKKGFFIRLLRSLETPSCLQIMLETRLRDFQSQHAIVTLSCTQIRYYLNLTTSWQTLVLRSRNSLYCLYLLHQAEDQPQILNINPLVGSLSLSSSSVYIWEYSCLNVQPI